LELGSTQLIGAVMRQRDSGVMRTSAWRSIAHFSTQFPRNADVLAKSGMRLM
jgi:hypothetical protein